MLETPAILFAASSVDRAYLIRQMAQLAFALAAYRAEHGEYPANLAPLAQKYIAAIPEDVFAGGPLH